jgi:iron(III) transport system substrate-binding protein
VGLVGPAAVGIVEGTDNEAAASAFVDFMLSEATQRHMAEVHFEIPFVKDVEPPAGMPTADELTVPGLDLRRLEDLQSTRELLTELGIIM